jgi:hypothetical protein
MAPTGWGERLLNATWGWLFACRIDVGRPQVEEKICLKGPRRQSTVTPKRCAAPPHDAEELTPASKR